MIRLATVLAVFTLVSSAPAADIAFDSAGDSAYNNGWTSGSNGGYGWGGGWSLTSFLVQPTVGDSTAYGFPDINSPPVVGGRAWQLQFAVATRPFSGPLSVGQTFSMDWVDDADGWQFTSVVSLLAPDGSVAVEVSENISDHYIVGPASGPFADTGIVGEPGAHLAITQTSTALQVSLTQYAPGTGTAVIDVPYSGQVSAVQIGTDVNPTFINNISITPEPSSIAVLGLAVCRLLVRRRGRSGSTSAGVNSCTFDKMGMDVVESRDAERGRRGKGDTGRGKGDRRGKGGRGKGGRGKGGRGKGGHWSLRHNP